MRYFYALLALYVMSMTVAISLALPARAADTGPQIAAISQDSVKMAGLSPAERIKAGAIDCPGCDLSGADLSNTCVKNGNLKGAKFDNVTALFMCMSLADFTDVSFRNADLTGANLGQSDLTRADLTGAKLAITSIKGANLSTVKGLTQAQLDEACADAKTKVPAGLTPRFCS